VPLEASNPALPAALRTVKTYMVGGERVVLDEDLAALFGVETRRLNEQVRRNQRRFEGYAFRLTAAAFAALMSQNATSKAGRGGRRKLPWAFTEHGVVMAATVLNSDTAIAAMKLVVEVFVRERRRRRSNLATTALADVAVTEGVGLVPRLQRALEALLDSVVDHRSQTTVREEAQALLAQSIQHLKDRLGRPGLENEAIAARAAKLLAEAEANKAAAAKTHAEAGEIELRTLARKLRLVIEAERSIAAGELDGFLAVLEDLGRA
jgi:hypothetical protein